MLFHTVAEADRASEREKRAPETCSGFRALDPLGHEIGRVEELYLDPYGKPRNLRVRIGGLFSARSVLIPVRNVDVDRERRTVALL